MTKVSKDDLIEEIASDFIAYLKNGVINTESIVKRLELQLNTNIFDFYRLLRIHFVLCDDVINFVEKLPLSLRRIKTNVKTETEVSHGEVRGKINWGITIKHRFSEDPISKILFVCDKREKNYDIPENIILKKIIHLITTILSNDLKDAISKKPDWLKIWVNKKDLKNRINLLYAKNIYLKRIKPTDKKITMRIISRSLKSRNPLYRDATALLLKYKNLMNFNIDKKETIQIFKNTFIEPEPETLFELYWIIKILNEFTDYKPEYQLIEYGNNIIAKWELEDYKYIIYHNSTGSSNISFFEGILDTYKDLKKKNNYIGRKLKAAKKFFLLTSRKSRSLWEGRPDILIEKYDKNNNLILIFLGEVKYTQNYDYALDGLMQLLEYIALVKESESYLKDYYRIYKKVRSDKKNVIGGLFIDNIKDFKISDDNQIRIYKYKKNKTYNIKDYILNF